MDNPIKAYRTANKLTLEALARAVGVQKAAVYKWERGIAPSAQTTVKIEEVTGVPRWKLRPDLWPEPQSGVGA